MKLYLLSLGCARNLVDSEIMLSKFSNAGYIITENPSEATIIVVNTCGFITPAAEESIETILELSNFKKNGVCKFLAVTGCLPQRFGKDIATELPEVDAFLGTGAYDKIIDAVKGILPKSRCIITDPNTSILQKSFLPRIQSTAYMAYVKIAEGCNRHCSYCIIPSLRGKQKSYKYENIIAEVKALIKAGTKEIILVAESTTDYGQDFMDKSQDNKADLAKIIKDIADISDTVWIRLLYGNPDTITDKIINVIGTTPNVCTYFDLPIQHASSKILKLMGRNYSENDLVNIFNNIKKTLPDATFRTTVITGFPGETDKDFNILSNFIEKIEFDHLGAFTYSDSEDLLSHKLSGHVNDETAQDRHDRLMAKQAKISSRINKKHLNIIYQVLIEENPEDGLFLGRTMFQAPEVDGITFVYGNNLKLGDFVNVKITDTYEYDLAGEVI